MVKIRPFRAVRPAEGYAGKVAALPYDVMTSEEAREMAGGNPYSFLHIDRAEIDLPPGADPYSPEAYARARANFERMAAEGVFAQDAAPRFYVYRLTMDGRPQTGLVGCASIDDYEAGIIKKHELTRADKEEDRVRHVDALDANTGPIFLASGENARLSALMDETAQAAPVYDFTAEDGVRHEAWLCGAAANDEIKDIFADMDALYIADGHHRCASAARVGKLRRAQNPGYTGEEEFNFFLAVVFPKDQLEILGYNRAVKDLNGLPVAAFLEKLREKFEVAPCEKGGGPAQPKEKHTFGLYVDGEWYVLRARPGLADESDPVARLDVSLLQDNVLAPILGIEDPRTDKRIDFIGGIRGLSELERRVNTDMAAAFALYPTTMDDLMGIADAGLIMPPKSTWFEPKLRSGLFVHKLGGARRKG
ncbi:MAG: DUF1015 family protein [Clostridiales Family XIII bacterium]|jgi:uncharacterized protein (DUF1015 family)|nr:DUF1015 family protein [Clostridiales Family XIII bacterium]